jgi:hypothetical protein
MKEEKPTKDYFSPNLKKDDDAGQAMCASGSGASGCTSGSSPGGPCNSGSNHTW